MHGGTRLTDLLIRSGSNKDTQQAAAERRGDPRARATTLGISKVKRNTIASLSLVLVLTAIASRAYSETTDASRVGSIPYLAVYKLAYLQHAAIVTNQIEGFCVESLRHDIKSDQISLFIDMKTGRIPIRLDKGSFDLPVSANLLAENPPIISNQPKGTLQLSYYFDNYVPVPESRVLSYRALVSPTIMARTMESVLDKTNIVNYPSILLLRVNDRVESNVVIRVRAGDINIPQVKDWVLYEIPLRSDLIGENPDVVLPGRNAYFLEDCGFSRPRRIGEITDF